MGAIEYHYVRLDEMDLYLEEEQLRLGTFFDLGVNQCALDGQRCVELFLASGLDRMFEQQIPKFVVGMSGTELLEYALEVCHEDIEVPNDPRWPVSPDYWVGYTLPCFQLATGYTYRSLFEVLTYDDLRGMHYRYQERTEDDFVRGVLELIASRHVPNRLQTRRKALGLTQDKLARLSGVSVRCIQLYEQGEKDINRAASDTVRRLSKVLRCSMEDIMEPFGLSELPQE